MVNKNSETPPLEAPLGRLEQALIEEFVRARGHDPAHLAQLPEDLREQLLKDASLYASARLSEVESRSQFLHDVHGSGVPGVHKTGLE
jgi:hypothetical protein